ncbi:MAG: cysteine synthase [Lentisphaerae bacterium GWF2_45_14]|nr:MAG: cysteine synthase [Lentisphaerae bacterium GWF2_45_14]
MQKICGSVLEVMKNTPVVELSRLTKGLKGSIFAKMEFLSPGLSKKDRVALNVITEAEKNGTLKPGQTVVELTSGNMGTGLAIACAVKGYPFVAVMSRGNSEERARMMSALGAEVVLVEQVAGSERGKVSGDDLKLVEIAAKKIVKERNAFRADQFNHQGNFNTHYLYTAQELIAQTDGKIDAFCDFAGTGGSFAGTARALKEYNPEIKCYLLEPEDCAVLSGRKLINSSHQIQGGGYSMTELKFINRKDIDGFLQVSDDEAIQTARDLAGKEGLFCGFSSGANVAGALQLLRGEMEGKNIAVILCDSGLKYLSTALWQNA